MSGNIRAMVLIVALLLAASGLSAQGSDRPKVRASLTVDVNSIAINYGDPPRGQGVLLRGEPLVLEIGVKNTYGSGVVWAERDWPQRIRARVRPGGRFDEEGSFVVLSCPVEDVRSSDATPAADYIMLASSGQQVVRCRIDQPAKALQAGRNTVIVEWADGAGMDALVDRERMPGRRSGLSGVLELEYRDVITADDATDLLNHLAVRAWYDRNYDKAIELAGQAIESRANNITALYIRGSALSVRGQCQAAESDLLRAADAIDQGRDVGHRRMNAMEFEERQKLAANVRARLAELKCP